MSIIFIATKHARYAEREFSDDDTVIDPFRYIANARRLGENKPELISILIPSRGRPESFIRTVETAKQLSVHPRSVEVIAYLDEDDAHNYAEDDHWLFPDARYIVGPQRLLSECWNECYAQARGEILMHCGDDIVFRTPSWDAEVRRVFAASEDKILLVHGDDCSPNTDALATHGFLHRRWIETLGYFVPPLFSSDWNDVWLTEVADMIGRRVKIPIVTEHMHYAFGKSDYDTTYREREERGVRDGVVELFKETATSRKQDAKKLRKVMRDDPVS